MAYCLICYSSFNQINSWAKLFAFQNIDPVCQKCENAFEIIVEDICRICGRPFKSISSEYRQDDLCYDCIRWEENPRWRNTLQKNRSVFLYNDLLKEVISLYKFRGDFVLVNAFKNSFQKSFNEYYNSSLLIVPIPLSEERLYERGFNQAKALANLLDLPVHDILSRTHHEKQSKKSRQERLASENMFFVTNTTIREKEILLIDDIYTTGATIRHAAEVLLRAGAQNVSSLTLARG